MHKEVDHVLYLGRMTPRNGFRAFVYGAEDKQTLANSWEEFEHLVGSGLWFSEKEDAKKTVKKRKKKD